MLTVFFLFFFCFFHLFILLLAAVSCYASKSSKNANITNVTSVTNIWFPPGTNRPTSDWVVHVEFCQSVWVINGIWSLVCSIFMKCVLVVCSTTRWIKWIFIEWWNEIWWKNVINYQQLEKTKTIGKKQRLNEKMYIKSLK